MPPEVLKAWNVNSSITTKETGSGVGLLTIRRIAEEHNGHVVVESERDVGTAIIIYLPVMK